MLGIFSHLKKYSLKTFMRREIKRNEKRGKNISHICAKMVKVLQEEINKKKMLIQLLNR